MENNDLFNDVLANYLGSHQIDDLALKESVKSYLEIFFGMIEIKFDDINNKSFFSLSEKDIARLKGKYDTFLNCCNYKKRDETIDKLKRNVYETFVAVMQRILKIESTNQDSIDILRDRLSKEIIDRLKENNVFTIQQLINLSKEDINSFWNPYSKAGKQVVKALHYMGYSFPNESSFCLIYDNGDVFNFFYKYDESLIGSKCDCNYVTTNEWKYKDDFKVEGMMCKSLKK